MTSRSAYYYYVTQLALHDGGIGTHIFLPLAVRNQLFKTRRGQEFRCHPDTRTVCTWSRYPSYQLAIGKDTTGQSCTLAEVAHGFVDSQTDPSNAPSCRLRNTASESLVQRRSLLMLGYRTSIEAYVARCHATANVVEELEIININNSAFQ